MPSKFPGLKTKRLWSIEGSRMNITADQTVMLWEWCSFSRWVCRYRRYRSIVGRAGSIRGPSCWPDPISWSTLEEMVHGGVLFDRVNLRKLWKLLFVHIWSSISPKSQRRNHHLPGQGSTFERLFQHFAEKRGLLLGKISCEDLELAEEQMWSSCLMGWNI